MSLTKTQLSIIEKARSVGSSTEGVGLDDEVCAYLVARIVHDLDHLKEFPELPNQVPPLFSASPLGRLRVSGIDFMLLFERLLTFAPDADAYFSCLAKLHKSRLKYEKILRTQPLPTLDQISPRGLLQFGCLSPEGLAALLFWRKWVFDIDNRAGQETGYLFEPILAHSIGGVPVSSSKSPIRRRNDRTKGRQVDCIRLKQAYEFKLRVTIAASGQGRWPEELEFPLDCVASGYVPVLVVLDPTPNPKLDELMTAFRDASGKAYVGKEAWDHLIEAAGETMGHFLHEYVLTPMQEIIQNAPTQLPDLTLSMEQDTFRIVVGGETLILDREPRDDVENVSQIPDDIEDELPGV